MGKMFEEELQSTEWHGSAFLQNLGHLQMWGFGLSFVIEKAVRFRSELGQRSGGESGFYFHANWFILSLKSPSPPGTGTVCICH